MADGRYAVPVWQSSSARKMKKAGTCASLLAHERSGIACVARSRAAAWRSSVRIASVELIDGKPLISSGEFCPAPKRNPKPPPPRQFWKST